MIKELRKQVFLALILSISAIILGIILIYAYSNYTNTINSATSVMDRFKDFSRINNFDEEIHINEGPFSMDLSNTYFYTIENGRIIENVGESNSEMDEYAIKAYNQNKENGIINDYVYKMRNMKNGRISIILMEDSNVVKRIQKIYIYTVIGCIISLIISYIVSKKLTNFIVKPVEETIQKQKQFISDASHELKTPLAVIFQKK